MLDRRDERQLHGLARGIARFRIWRVVSDPFQLRVRVRLKPRHVGCRGTVRHLNGGGCALVRQPALRALAARERVETRISRNPIEPGAKRATLEAVEAAPGAQVGFLHEVLGFMHGAQHAITMHLGFPAATAQPAVQTPGLNALRLPSDASVSALPWPSSCQGTASRPFAETTNTLPFDRSGCVTTSRAPAATSAEVGGESML